MQHSVWKCCISFYILCIGDYGKYFIAKTKKFKNSIQNQESFLNINIQKYFIPVILFNTQILLGNLI